MRLNTTEANVRGVLFNRGSLLSSLASLSLTYNSPTLPSFFHIPTGPCPYHGEGELSIVFNIHIKARWCPSNIFPWFCLRRMEVNNVIVLLIRLVPEKGSTSRQWSGWPGNFLQKRDFSQFRKKQLDRIERKLYSGVNWQVSADSATKLGIFQRRKNFHFHFLTTFISDKIMHNNNFWKTQAIYLFLRREIPDTQVLHKLFK